MKDEWISTASDMFPGDPDEVVLIALSGGGFDTAQWRPDGDELADDVTFSWNDTEEPTGIYGDAAVTYWMAIPPLPGATRERLRKRRFPKIAHAEETTSEPAA